MARPRVAATVPNPDRDSHRLLYRWEFRQPGPHGYTIIGNEVNLAARLQSAIEPGSILLSHETNALVQGLVMTEEQPPITVKGFPKPISGYKLVGTYDDLVKAGRVVLEERDGLRVLVDLTKQNKTEVIQILQGILAHLRGKKKK